jgi:uncharacterized membrane protein (DUF485 family)
MNQDVWVWVGLVLTLILGLPGAYIMGVLGNLHTPRWSQYLQSRNLLKTHKSKQKALLVFNRIKDFHEGKRDKYPFYILLASGAIISTTLGYILILLVLIENHGTPVAPECGIILIISAGAFVIAAVLLTSIYETSRQLERFDDYKAEFEQRWGPVDTETP